MVIDAAYARCLSLARQHYENFPVASRLLPKAARPHIAAIYAFARIADDFADEGTRTPAARYALLDDWERRLGDGAVFHRFGQIGDRSQGLSPNSPNLWKTAPSPNDADAIFLALGDTIRRFELEQSLFTDLLSAFRQDVETTRYETWADVFDYCRRSANPIGRLVLRVSGYRDAKLDHWSDPICTGLQLVNFWQDLAIDFERNRLYVPLEVIRDVGADLEDLRRRRWTNAWRLALAQAAAKTRQCFERGRPLVDAVRGRLRWELRATWLGGMRILQRLERQQFDVFATRPTLGARDAMAIAGGTIVWRKSQSQSPS